VCDTCKLWTTLLGTGSPSCTALYHQHQHQRIPNLARCIYFDTPAPIVQDTTQHEMVNSPASLK
jgi:hypothetical protein